jgi:hypothetical protein
MKKNLLLIAFVLFSFTSVVKSQTVIWSDDFESYADAATAGTAGFTVWEGSGAVTDVTVTLVGTANSGNKYLVGTRSNTINKTLYLRKTAALTLVEGNSYILEAWVKSPNGLAVKTGVKLGTAADINGTQSTTSSTWTKISQAFTVGVGQTAAVPFIQMYSYPIANKVHVDDMRVLLAYNIAASGTNGTVTGTGITAEGTSATLTATPSSGYHFVNWTEGGSEVSTNPIYTFTVSGARTLVANFAADISTDINVKANGLNTVNMSVVNGNLTIVNVLPLTAVRVFDTLGRMVINEIAKSKVFEITLPSKGIYVVKVGSLTKKVIVQ